MEMFSIKGPQKFFPMYIESELFSEMCAPGPASALYAHVCVQCGPFGLQVPVHASLQHVVQSIESEVCMQVSDLQLFHFCYYPFLPPILP